MTILFIRNHYNLYIKIHLGKKMTLAVSTSELFGLIFFALLKREFYHGAKQLVETGFVSLSITIILDMQTPVT